ncbi:MAG: hypothetical protein CMP68_05485 [Flavobacteriales bacterium]|nr:hypothetical protein [Flavobacteriales bacterium]|tara:strand:+ start:1497 stop:1934 length:438 start_codon:yes stop_codon:yes gene_type:complete
MKKLILSFIALMFFSFSFAQVDAKANMKKFSKKELTKNSMLAVDFLKKELKLRGSKLTAVQNAFKKYAENIATMEEKISLKDKSAAGNSEALVANKKAKFKMMNNFLKLRDQEATKGYSTRDLEKYRKSSRSIHPFTLKIKELKK